MVRQDIVINHATVRTQWSMPRFVRACAWRGMSRVSVWGEEIDRIGLDAAKAALADAGLSAFGYNRAGPLTAADAPSRKILLDAGRREIDQAAEIGAEHILVFPGGLSAGSKDIASERARVEDAIAELLVHARGCKMPLALEPLHPMLAGDRTTLTSLSAANDICDRLGDGIGVVIDVYHVWWDERLKPEIARTGEAGRILGFHVNDWLVPTKHILRDRGMMGDGIIDLAGIWRDVCAAGYDGPIEVEIFSDDWWNRDADEVLDIALARCEAIFPEKPGR